MNVGAKSGLALRVINLVPQYLISSCPRWHASFSPSLCSLLLPVTTINRAWKAERNRREERTGSGNEKIKTVHTCVMAYSACVLAISLHVNLCIGASYSHLPWWTCQFNRECEEPSRERRWDNGISSSKRITSDLHLICT